MEFSRRDFLRSTAVMAAAAGVLGAGSVAFADQGEENCLPVVNVAAQSRDELARRFQAGRSGKLEYCAFSPKRLQPQALPAGSAGQAAPGGVPPR